MRAQRKYPEELRERATRMAVEGPAGPCGVLTGVTQQRPGLRGVLATQLVFGSGRGEIAVDGCRAHGHPAHAGPPDCIGPDRLLARLRFPADPPQQRHGYASVCAATAPPPVRPSRAAGDRQRVATSALRARALGLGLPTPPGRLTTAIRRRLAPTRDPSGHRAHLAWHPLPCPPWTP
jgi:hypothetical protein